MADKLCSKKFVTQLMQELTSNTNAQTYDSIASYAGLERQEVIDSYCNNSHEITNFS